MYLLLERQGIRNTVPGLVFAVSAADLNNIVIKCVKENGISGKTLLLNRDIRYKCPY